MREIITLQIGGCGNLIGDSFWEVVTSEHNINPLNGNLCEPTRLQAERLSVYFNETANGSYYSRAVAIDTDPILGDRILSSQIKAMYNPQLIISGTSSSGNNFGRGYYTEGAQLTDTILDKIRKQAEDSDCMQGFQIIHSIGGGTGSGLSSLVIDSLSEEYPQQLISNFTIIPSEHLSNVVVEPYNSVLSFPHLISNTHQTFLIDNEALYNISTRQLKMPKATMHDLNHIVSHAMSGVTTCLRFPGQLNSGLRKLYVNMVPFPPLHFFIPGFAPLTSCYDQHYTMPTVRSLVDHLFSSENMLAAVDFNQGKLMTVAAIFRGLMSPKVIDEMITAVRNRNIHLFVDWIPNNFKTGICDVPPRGLKMSSTLISNTTAVTHLFNRLLCAFNAMMQQKAHLHWYTSEGMEQEEFDEAQNAIKELIDQYKSCVEPLLTENKETDCCSEDKITG